MFKFKVENLNLKRDLFELNNINFKITAGECLHIIGPSGSGKSTLLSALKNSNFIRSGKISGLSKDEIYLICNLNHFKNNSGISDFYYQQRFDASFADNNSRVFEELLLATKSEESKILEVLQWLNISYLADQNLIKLSNGENKKFQIAKALLTNNKLILMDNPFMGLDADSYQNLLQIFIELRKNNIALILSCLPSQISDDSQTVLELNGNQTRLHKGFIRKVTTAKFQKTISLSNNSSKTVVELKNVNVKYGAKTILENFSWKIFSGQKWLLTGPNGAGKSTILSLINADNSQAYANDIYLFGNKRGSGESIWEIKNKIGFFSPELHQYFDMNHSVHQALGCGFSDSLNKNMKLSDLQIERIDYILELLDLKHLRDIALSYLPFSLQRMTLLGRAIIKQSPLLILDEPCQGLDEAQIEKVKNITNMLPTETTLIYVTHRLNEIPETVNCCLEIEKGKVIRESRA